MKDFYMKRLESYIKDHPSIAKQIIENKFGQALELYELRDLNDDEAIKLYYEIKNAVAIYNSPYDQKKIAYAIQSSRSGIGGAAMTMFECAFCGKEELWSNTAVPRICKDCANEMAKDIILHGYDLLKNGGNNK